MIKQGDRTQKNYRRSETLPVAPSNLRVKTRSLRFKISFFSSWVNVNSIIIAKYH